MNRSPSLVSAMVSLLCDDDACQLTVIGPRGRESVVPLSRDTAQRLDAALTDAGG
ncbi:hypothetical protein [Iamia sp.]|uniref:hypothetical protein n=1 Tax=Iamia sp. TaxID=2722710 RepID=UPI002CFB7DE7|nr:hypothetical protein [Iamia sp.]HXH56590.1 hypothetical protein [Iamia sp.]